MNSPFNESLNVNYLHDIRLGKQVFSRRNSTCPGRSPIQNGVWHSCILKKYAELSPGIAVTAWVSRGCRMEAVVLSSYRLEMTGEYFWKNCLWFRTRLRRTRWPWRNGLWQVPAKGWLRLSYLLHCKPTPITGSEHRVLWKQRRLWVFFFQILTNGLWFKNRNFIYNQYRHLPTRWNIQKPLRFIR